MKSRRHWICKYIMFVLAVIAFIILSPVLVPLLIIMMPAICFAVGIYTLYRLIRKIF